MKRRMKEEKDEEPPWAWTKRRMKDER